MEVVGIYNDVISGTKFDREGLNKIYELCRNELGYADYLLIEKWDRFGRNTELHFATVRQFKEIGAEVNAVYQMIDFSQSMWPNFLGMYATSAHSESLAISQRTKNGIAEAQRRGQWTASAPIGFKRIETAQKTASGGIQRIIHPHHVKGKYIKEIYESFVMGIERHELFKQYGKKLGVKKSSFYDIFTNVVYAGYIDCKEHNFLKAERVKGLHKPIISLEIFNAAQAIINKSSNPNFGKSWSIVKPQLDKFYLKGLLKDNDGGKLTASLSKGKKKRYAYYHNTKKPRYNLSVEFAHSIVDQAI